MVHPRTAFSTGNQQVGGSVADQHVVCGEREARGSARSGSESGGNVSGRLITRPRDELEAEVEDPWFMGWEAGENLDDPPPCPFTDGIKARLWRKGFADRVQQYISTTKRAGLATSLT